MFASSVLSSKKFKCRNGEVVILMYHGVVSDEPDLPDWCLLQKDRFENQIEFLKQHFNIISLSAAVKGLKDGSIVGPTAVITFDDGYSNNYEVAFPILKEHQVPATIYLTTRFIGTDETIWTGVLQDAFTKTSLTKMEWRGQKLNLGSNSKKKASLELVKLILKKEHFSEIEKSTKEIVEYLSDGKSFQIEYDSPYRMLNSDMITEMSSSGLIEFGAHTHNHPILSGLSKQEQKDEINESIRIVSDLTGSKCFSFAYPNGVEGDYTESTITILRGLDVSVALSTQLGLCNMHTPLLDCKRYGVGSDSDFKRGLYNLYFK